MNKERIKGEVKRDRRRGINISKEYKERKEAIAMVRDILKKPAFTLLLIILGHILMTHFL